MIRKKGDGVVGRRRLFVVEKNENYGICASRSWEKEVLPWITAESQRKPRGLAVYCIMNPKPTVEVQAALEPIAS